MNELVTTQVQLVDGLKQALEQQGQGVVTRETHISWVVLAGQVAWKIKKAVDFGFLDFSSLEKRRQACEEELRLNRRFAPELYLDVVAITGSPAQPRFGGTGQAIEYAVKMRRFDESGLLSELAKKQQLEPRHIDAVATEVAAIHQAAPSVVNHAEWGEPGEVHRWLTESIEHIKRLVTQPSRQAQIESIDRRCQQHYQQLKPVLYQRQHGGAIRECHGDLHLRNIVWFEDKLVLFDCIEFNPALRWIDVISEVAFVVMDVEERGYPALAWRFINRYLSITGDYAGLAVLRYYITYRALVRAKVKLLQRDDAKTPADKKPILWQQYTAYIDLAERSLNQHRPALMIMYGFSASGKSTVAANLASQYGCIHLRSDVERKRLHGLSEMQASHAGLNADIYSSSATEKTYQQLAQLAKSIIVNGYPVVVDATFLQRHRRDQFQKLASELKVPFLIIHCDADVATLESRIKSRAAAGNDPSEANLAVLQQQIQHHDPLAADELFIEVGSDSAVHLPTTLKKRLLG